jgi:hypothetical protein
MNRRHLLIALAIVAGFASCTKNNVSKIPHIALKSFGPQQIRTIDTAVLTFSLVDGDADLGADDGKDIFVKDRRFESIGFVPYTFPAIVDDIKDPKKGLEGECIFAFPALIYPRTDTAHAHSDTTSFEVYIVDRAGNKSNIITTPDIIVTQ